MIRGFVWAIVVAAWAALPILAEEPLPPGTITGTPSHGPGFEPPPLPSVPSLPPLTETNPLEERLKPTIELRGRIDADLVQPIQSTLSQEEVGTLIGGYGFRRARLGAQGTVGDAAMWVAEFDFATGAVRLRDVFVGLTAIPYTRQINIGNFREPFSLEGATSARFTTFMERSPLNQLDPTRHWGFGAYWWPDDERYTYALGGFLAGSNNGTEQANGGAWAVTTRLTGLPIYEEEGIFRLVHLGGAFSYVTPPNGVVEYNFGSQSNLLVVSDNPVSPLLPQINVLAYNQQLYNLQAAAVYGPLSVQGEWFGTAIQQREAGLIFLHGFYADVSYFLTGEHRGYDRTGGKFDQVQVLRPFVRPNGSRGTGCGAWQIAARYTLANFNSPNLFATAPPEPNGPQAGTILHQATLGVNWYLNDYTRLMLNYIISVPVTNNLSTQPISGISFRTAIYW